jgi:hypothetical protein
MSSVLDASSGIDLWPRPVEIALLHVRKEKRMKREFSVLEDLISDMSENFDI